MLALLRPSLTLPARRTLRRIGWPVLMLLALATGFGPTGADNTVKVWDVPSSSALRSLTEKDAVNALALSPDGTKLATAGKDGAVKLWNSADFKQPLFTMTGHAGAVRGVSFSGNGQILAS